jgi:hypothetical protein
MNEICDHKSIRWRDDKQGFTCQHCGAVFKDTKVAVFPVASESSGSQCPHDGIPVNGVYHLCNQCQYPVAVWEGIVYIGALDQIGKHVKETGDISKGWIPSDDPVNHPRHYTSHPSGIECIQVVRHFGFNLGNAIKYIWRADLKNDAVEDLRKAVFYLNDEISKRTQTPLT